MMAAPADRPLRGILRHDEPMARHTSWRVGGPARLWYQPADLEDLAVFLRSLPAEERLVWVGLGSNLLVRDGGIDAVVIAPFGGLDALQMLDDGLIRAEAGVACNKVARFAARHGLVGAEFLAGIPGSMGGALAMNAGAFGGETWRLVAAVETIDRHGERRTRLPADFEVGYREVSGPAGEWFVAAHLRLEAGDVEGAQARIRALLERRAASQPIGEPSCGSVFRNPPGDHAARLIEACGLKGRCIGAACVSQRHANFIINTGGARAADIEALIVLVQAEVERCQGVRLEPEVRILGVAGGAGG
ncbi:UDP-N-acetylmuramate dehydrogenase [Thiohalobacter sp. IOR34]|uniref:UDP-N-acetylmuramate dehydrogenase n=1 Tax=Thiohalobacter sp. IOR34 TaxID=3057176 RepID=UPI0025AF2FAD|nr:UDP-N-acetylmuramate dehydrogenase [Thiohalobacter sp. IOR34]WJW75005.1 UDP-N-acetylmuramate dehydrogenase [Thiohalobacter sp. IOR34]